MALINTAEKQCEIRPLKRAKTGFETEMHVLNEDGSISYEGYKLVGEIKEKHPEVDIVKECGQNMIEFGCYPDINAYNPALEIVESIEKTIEYAKTKNLKVYPFSTYPGTFETKFTPEDSGKYKIKEAIFGREKFELATKVVGFHHHYTLPKGVFDFEKKELKLLMDSKLKRSLLNCYNMEIAIDPILTLLTQSSPFHGGKYMAKNSRMLLYRGGRKLSYDGVYSKFQLLGGLPPYKQTETDLLHSLEMRQRKWKKLVETADPDADFDKLYPYKLDITWGPVKINKHGTLEQRGMDMNYLSIILGISAMIKFVLRKIQREFIEVIPADLAINEPFKEREGIIFIPPQTFVRNKLQRASARKGFDDEYLTNYAKKFIKLAKSCSPEFYYPLYKKIEDMVDKRMSTSDEMIAFANVNEMIDKNNEISDEDAKKIALYFSDKFEEDLQETKRTIMEIVQAHEEVLKKKCLEDLKAN